MPEPRPDLLRFLRFHSFTSRSQGELRMSSLICNDPRTTAYSACCNCPILFVQAHNTIEHEQNLAVYSKIAAQSKTAVWLYMPIDEGEYISHIWKRSGKLSRELALLVSIALLFWIKGVANSFKFITNKGRVMLFGPQPHSQRRSFLGPWRWTLLYMSDGSPSRIFFDVSPHGIHKLAFEAPEPIHPGGYSPVVPAPSSPYPESTSLSNYFYTCATLKNVVEVTPCERKVAGKRSIIGLLFRYSDGTKACVGQFRLDCAATTLVVGNRPQLWLSFDNDNGRPLVGDIGLSRAPKPKSCDCLYVTWDGKLEWWFTYNQCQLYYKDQSSLQTQP